MNLYLFNPDADLALANHLENYIPPFAARQMAFDLAMLPVWYAEPGSAVLLPLGSDVGSCQSLLQTFDIDVRLITVERAADCIDMHPVPWGWNLAVRRRLMQIGFPENLLPSYERLLCHRIESSRGIGAERLSELFQLPYCTGKSCILETLSECHAYVQMACTEHASAIGDAEGVLPGCVLKAPWSSSGKGLKWCRRGFTDSVQGWCERLLKEQGYLHASPIYDRVKDFALEFYVDEQEIISFVGYSSFSTSSTGAYWGNELLSTETFEHQFAAYIPVSVLHDVRKRLTLLLSSYARAGYKGYLGVDMMICRSSSGYLLHPGVEVNLRMNMGVLALLLQQRLLAPGSTGYFRVEYFSSGSDLYRQHCADKEAFPLCMDKGRLSAGYLSLTPISCQGRYRAAVWVTASPSLP